MQYVRSGRADDTGPTRTDRHRHEPGRDRLRAGRRMKLQQQPWSRCDTEASRTRARNHCARAPDRRCEREMTASDRCESAYSTSEPDGPRPRTRTTAPIGIKPDHDSRLGSNRVVDGDSDDDEARAGSDRDGEPDVEDGLNGDDELMPSAGKKRGKKTKKKKKYRSKAGRKSRRKHRSRR